MSTIETNDFAHTGATLGVESEEAMPSAAAQDDAHDQQETAASFDGDLSFDSFVMSDRGLEHDSKFVCQPFKVLGRCRKPAGDGWSRLLCWQDADGRDHRFTV